MASMSNTNLLMLRDALPKLGRVKRYTLMAVRIPTPMGREPQAAHQPREHGSTLNFARSRAGQ
ncbi:hypothetical protein PspLS_07413 [Pyricularia sp. CBS 133598]|nr:hypothetical protein PspLS_07413 [Pyricularia sp. CBS 133598]